MDDGIEKVIATPIYPTTTDVLSMWPEHPLPFEIKKRPTVQQSFLEFEEHLCHRDFVSMIGKLTVKPGHFFTLIANSSTVLKKGWVPSARDAEHARELARTGCLLHSDISGYEFSRAARMRLVGDIIENPHLILSPIEVRGEEKERHLHVKRYAGHKKSVLLCATTIESDGCLGLRSFHLHEATLNWLRKHKPFWKSDELNRVVWEG